MQPKTAALILALAGAVAVQAAPMVPTPVEVAIGKRAEQVDQKHPLATPPAVLESPPSSIGEVSGEGPSAEAPEPKKPAPEDTSASDLDVLGMPLSGTGQVVAPLTHVLTNAMSWLVHLLTRGPQAPGGSEAAI